MEINDPEVEKLIERLGDHYRTNISNRYIRPALLYLPLDNQAWDLINRMMESNEQYRYKGFQLEELYQQISAVACFIGLARKELMPILRIKLRSIKTSAGTDRVLREMAINNFSFNLKIFADVLNELYIKLVEIDKEASKGKAPLYTRMPELQELGKQLIEE